MQVPIEDIKVKKRVRQDTGDISSLAESMKRFGLISPILLSKSNVLIAGGRRLEAAKSLGWRTINAVITELPNDTTALEFEVEENVQRQNFSTEEIVAAAKQINKIKNPGILRRIWRAVVNFFKRIFRIKSK
jgi:ParB family chromosome partitioning protein